MDKANTLKTIEDMLDQSQIPMNEYLTCINKPNGGFFLDISRKDDSSINHMYLFSEIFNSVSLEWKVEIKNNKIHIIV
jgi:hypothetical protein